MANKEIKDFSAAGALALTDLLLIQSGGVTKNILGSDIQALLLGGALRFTGVLTPAQITADQDDYAPAGYGVVSTLRLSSDAERTITGIVPPAALQYVYILQNVGSYPILLANESGSSAAANRFSTELTKIIGPSEMCLIVYDTTASRWRVLGKDRTNIGTYRPASNVAVPSSVYTKIPMGVETVNCEALQMTGGNIVCLKAGRFVVVWEHAFTASGQWYRDSSLYLNGSPHQTGIRIKNVSDFLRHRDVWNVNLNVGDYIAPYVFTFPGHTAATSSYMRISKVDG